MRSCRNLHLTQTESITSKYDIGLYRDDGLIHLRKLNKQKTDKIRRNIIEVFKTVGFQIEIETNLHEVNFLDITFNSRSGTDGPYEKANDKLLCVHALSNHPSRIIRELQLSVTMRQFFK